MNEITENTDNKEIEQGTEEVKTLAPTQRMKGMERFKDKEYESTEQALNDVLDALEEVTPQSEEAEKIKNDMIALFNKHREIPYLIKVAEETGDFQVAIQSLYDNDDDMLMREGDEGYENLKKIRSDRIEKSNMENELLDKYNKNKEDFPAMFEQWAGVRGLKDEDKEGMYSFLDDMLVKLVSGDVDKDILDKMYQAYAYKRDMGELDEDKAIAQANAENANQKQEKPLVAIPEGSSPKANNPDNQTKNTPFEDVFKKHNIK